MAVDLSFLPDKQASGKVDLSFLPDQSQGTDLSFLPDQPTDGPNILQKSASNIKDFVSPVTSQLTSREPLADPSPYGDIQQGRNFRETYAPLADPNILFPGTTQGRAGDISAVDMFAPITSQSARLTGQKIKEGKPFQALAQAGLTSAAIPADLVGTGISLFGDVIQGAMKVGRAGIRALKPGKKSKEGYLPFGLDVKQQMLGADRSHGNMIQKEMIPRLNKRFEKVVAEGMDPKKARDQMYRELVIRGAVPDMAEEVALTAMFFRKALTKKLFGREARLADIQAARSELRAIRASEEMQGVGKPLGLPGPGQAGGTASEGVGIVGAPQEPIVGKGFIGADQGFKSQIAQPIKRNVIEIGAREAGRVKEVGSRAGDPIIDIKGKVRPQQEASKEVRMAQAADAKRAAEAQAAGDLQRSKIAGEKAFPPSKQKALPPAEAGARPPQGQGNVGPFAGEGFIGESEGFIKEGSEKAIRIGKKRRLDAAAIEGKKKSAVRGAIVSKYGPKKLALPAPEKPYKDVLPVEKDVIAGKGFVVGGKKGPGAGGKKVSERANIIEKSSGQREKTSMSIALDKAGIDAKAARAAKDVKKEEQLDLFKILEKDQIAKEEAVAAGKVRKKIVRKTTSEVKVKSKSSKKLFKDKAAREKDVKETPGQTIERMFFKDKKGSAQVLDDAGKPLNKKEAAKYAAQMQKLKNSASASRRSHIDSLEESLYSLDKSEVLRASGELRGIAAGKRGVRDFSGTQYQLLPAKGSPDLLTEVNNVSRGTRDMSIVPIKFAKKAFGGRKGDWRANTFNKGLRYKKVRLGPSEEKHAKVIFYRPGNEKNADKLIKLFEEAPSRAGKDAAEKLLGRFKLGNKGFAKTGDGSKKNIAAKKAARGKKRTLKDQLKDVKDSLDIKQEGLGSNLGNVKRTRKAKEASARLAQDAKDAGVSLAQYLRDNNKTLKLSPEKIRSIIAIQRDLSEVRKASLASKSRKLTKDEFVTKYIDSDFFQKGRKIIRGNKAAELESKYPDLTDTALALAKDKKSLNIALAKERIATRNGVRGTELNKLTAKVDALRDKVAINPLSQQSKDIAMSKKKADKLTKALEKLVPDLHKGGSGRSIDKQRQFEHDAINYRIEALLKERKASPDKGAEILKDIKKIKDLRKRRFDELLKLETLENERPRTFSEDALSKDHNKLRSLREDIQDLQADLADNGTALEHAKKSSDAELIGALEVVNNRLEAELANTIGKLKSLGDKVTKNTRDSKPSYRTFLTDEAKMDKVSMDKVIASRREMYNESYRQGGLTAQDANSRLAELDEIAVDIGQLKNIYKSAKQRGIAHTKGDVKTILDNKGFARTGKPKKTSDADRAARIKRMKEKITDLKLKKAGKVSVEKATLGDIVDNKTDPVKYKRMKKNGRGFEEAEITGTLEIEFPTEVQAIDKAGKPYTKLVGGTKVGNTKVGEMVMNGDMSERDGKILMAAQKINPIIGGKFAETTQSERMSSIGNASIKEVLAVVERVDPRELAALHDTPVSQALSIAKRAQDNGIDIMTVMDEISQDLFVARKVANIMGVNLNAIRRSVAKGDLRSIMEARLKKGGLSKYDKEQLLLALKELGSKKARSNLARTLDMVTKYGINSMLSSPVTFMRNLAGSALGISSQIPAKIAQATVSNIAALFRIPQTERTYYREVVPEIVGMVKGFVRGVRKGGRFLKHEDVAKVFASVEKKIARVKAIHIPKGQSFSTLKRNQKAALLKQLRGDLKDLLTEEELTRAAELGYSSNTKITSGGAARVVEDIIDVPVRMLVATDKVFQTSSASGHIAARRAREAIKSGKSIKDIRLTAAQIEEAKIDAAFNVFRQKLGPTMGKVQNLISDTPLMPLMIPFLKSRINFVKFGLKNSPLGLIDTVWKSVAAGKIDTKSAGRTIAGTAIMLGIDKYFEKNSDTIQLQPSAANQAERAMLRESGISEQVVVYGTNLNDPKKRKITSTEPYANAAPVSGPLEVIALKQEYYRRLKRGDPIGEAFAKTFNKAVRGVLNQSAFGGIKDSVRAAENMADTSVALKKDGTPEFGIVGSLLRGPAAQVVYKRAAGIAIPNFVRDIRKLQDKRILDPKTFSERLLSELPKVWGKDPAKDIPARPTVFGGEAKRTNKRIPFNPFAGKQKIDRTIEKMINLEIFPGKAPTSLSLNGAPIVLTEDEKRQFHFLGKGLKKELDNVVSMDGFDDISELGQKLIIEELIENFRSVQVKKAKGEGLLRLIQSDEGINQIIRGITGGFSF